MNRNFPVTVSTVALIGSVILGVSGCAEWDSSGLLKAMNTSVSGIEKTQISYEKTGNYWGRKLKIDNRKAATSLPSEYTRGICEYVLKKEPSKGETADLSRKNNVTISDIDAEFVYAMYSKAHLDYFNVHSELKDSFKKGFRLGYEDRIADLVLGPHLTVTAACIGTKTSRNFVEVINVFEKGWVHTLQEAIDAFIVLISEGSQSDRDVFVKEFIRIYSAKFKETEARKAEGMLSQLSAGGTVLYINMSKDAGSAALDIPLPDGLKAELYRQTFKVMGDELGRRYATNLIKRDELVDLLRRVKPVLNEVGSREANLSIIRDAFIEQYKADGQSLFQSMLANAGYDNKSVAK